MMKRKTLTQSLGAKVGAEKIANVLVGYLRDGDNMIIKNVFQMNEETQPELYKTFQNDYDIQDEWKNKGEITSKTGVLMQSRTKGQGGKAPKTRAFTSTY